ncbi:MAG: SCP2 sterol-binding domain-containing protein [Thiobacillus sp.]|jgi:putative sterol carrier protein|uniref:SCP2 sterol-binding domain-containing protein n=1 Tax=Thiobacillus sp. TaxID=924 RepID=UPI0027339427|nr:SCP2 sterol-binding domain-containing protein [Thiobacillus sp.]MDP3586399.1 SCP2 sterol-binding domain-containing protein [Thiobacillus sp.]
MKYTTIALAALAVLASTAHAAPAMMSAEWTAQACDAWNKDATLTSGLANDWIKNDKGRGHKIIHLYRTDCGEATKTEMRIAAKDGKAMCVYGGAVESTNLDLGADYVMHATSQRWNEMGAGEYGPMKAMMFGRLKFSGPKVEAMSVMGPFEAFLRLPGKIAGDKACPAK